MLAATRLIQRAALAWNARRPLRVSYETGERHIAAVSIQRAVRGVVKRQELHHRRVAAAMKVLGALRAIVILRLRVRRARQAKAAMFIQSLYRGSTSRAQTRAMRRQAQSSAVILQGPLRDCQRKVVADQFRGDLNREQAATMMQSWWRRGTRYKRLVGIPVSLDRECLCAATDCRGPKSVDYPERHTHVSTAKRESPLSADASRWALLLNGQGVRKQLVQSAVQALADGMARQGTITPADALDLRQVLAAKKGDALLEQSLRKKILGLSSAGFNGQCVERMGKREIAQALQQAITATLRTMPFPSQ